MEEMNNKLIDILHRKLGNKSITDNEEQYLLAWINESPENIQLYSDLGNKEKMAIALKEFGEPDTEASLIKIKQSISFNEKLKRSKVTRLFLFIRSLFENGLLHQNSNHGNK